MKINPGRMRDRIILLKRDTKNTTTNGVIQEVEYWKVMASVWAQFRPAGGREFRDGSVEVNEQRATFTILYREDLGVVDRLVFEGRLWDVKSIVRVGWKAALDVNAVSSGEAYSPEGTNV